MVVLATLAFAGGALASDWDLHSDSWVATDALGRKLPGYKECGPPRKDQFVGMFYFIWLYGPGPYDNAKIIHQNPEDPKYGPKGAFHHWSEPETGYYVTNDAYMMRRHMMMLSEAGIDTIIIDVTNALTYSPNYMKLFEIMTQLRKEGMYTPQMCFFTHSLGAQTVKTLYDEFYSKNLFPDLWFKWEGKPLILAAPKDCDDKVKEMFTIRETWFGHDPNDWFGDGQGKWTWLDPYPQEPGWQVKGAPEEVSVGSATLALAGVGRSYEKGSGVACDRFITTPTSVEGRYFRHEWDRALKLDPKFIFITGWNEYIYALALMRSENMKTLPIGITALAGNDRLDWNALMATAVIAVIPMTIIFIFFQRHLVSGLTAGAVKG